MPSSAGFLEPKKSRLGPSKSTFNAENFIRSLPLCISHLILAQFALEMSLTARNRQKIHKNPYFDIQGYPRSLILVPIESQPGYNFLLVINSKLGPILHRF